MDFFVALDGNDEWSGTLADVTGDRTDGPFATIERARSAVRANDVSAVVHIRGGKYFLAQPIIFGAEDSGTADEPVIYTSYRNEQARLIGGQEISGWQPVSDESILSRLTPDARKNVRAIDLKALGIHDYGTYHPRGHSGGSNVAALELFYNQQVMTVSRWPKTPPLPNRGFEHVVEVVEDPEKGQLVRYHNDRPSHWKSLEDIYVHGYWGNDWSSSITGLQEINTQDKLLAPTIRNWCHYGTRKDQRFFYFHILEELSEPGEWYLDFKTGMLYFWPPDEGSGETIVSIMEAPMIQLADVEHVRFERLTVECMRGNAFEISGGRNITIAGCELRNIGRDAAKIIKGTEHQIISCDVHHTGECGIRIEAGDRKTLTPSRHRVHNCHFHHIAREGWTYFGAVWLDHSMEFGCGTTVSHNRMHEHRHALMNFKGNDHVVEFNEMYNCTLEGDDCGAMYTGRDTAMQGNVVRYNHFHHVGDSGRNDWGSFGVYMDDGGGGTDIYGNVFQYINKAVLAGGGMNIVIRNNIFADCQPAIWFDERGASAGAEGEGGMFHGVMKSNFYSVNADSEVYAKYPNIDKAHEAYQKHLGLLSWGSAIANNIVVGSKGNWLSTLWPAIPDRMEFHDNMIDEDPGFSDPAFGIFALSDDSPAFSKIGFRAIPVHQMGLIHDAYRTEIPDVKCAIEILQKIGGNGEPGKARLICKNAGDTNVEGIELIEFKLRRHGPGICHVEVPYRVAADTTESFEFDVSIPREHLDDLLELWICSRGEADLRPAWTVIPVAYSMESSLEIVEPVIAGRTPVAGKIRCTVRNTGGRNVSEEISLAVFPAGSVVVPEGGTLMAELAPSASVSRTFEFSVNPDFREHSLSRITIATHGEGLKPASATAIVQYPLPELGGIDVSGIRDALERDPFMPVKGTVRYTPVHVHRADVKFGLVGDALAFYGVAFDSRPETGQMFWDGSCFEIFGSSPDRERIGHVFGEIRIGQVCLLPACAGLPARGAQVVLTDYEWRDDIRVLSETMEGRYEIQALIPLKYLAVSPGAQQFLFEVLVCTKETHGKPGGHASLFNSHTAFNDTTQYAMAVRRFQVEWSKTNGTR